MEVKSRYVLTIQRDGRHLLISAPRRTESMLCIRVFVYRDHVGNIPGQTPLAGDAFLYCNIIPRSWIRAVVSTVFRQLPATNTLYSL